MGCLFRLSLICHTSNLISISLQGANPVTEITKRPITVGTHFKNDVCDLIELLENQASMSTINYHIRYFLYIMLKLCPILEANVHNSICMLLPFLSIYTINYIVYYTCRRLTSFAALCQTRGRILVCGMNS